MKLSWISEFNSKWVIFFIKFILTRAVFIFNWQQKINLHLFNIGIINKNCFGIGVFALSYMRIVNKDHYIYFFTLWQKQP